MAKEPDQRYPDANENRSRPAPGAQHSWADAKAGRRSAGIDYRREARCGRTNQKNRKIQTPRLGASIATAAVVVALIVGWLLRFPDARRFRSAKHGRTCICRDAACHRTRNRQGGSAKPGKPDCRLSVAAPSKLDEKADEAGKPRKTGSEKAATKAVARTKRYRTDRSRIESCQFRRLAFCLAGRYPCLRPRVLLSSYSVRRPRRAAGIASGHWDNVPECAAQTNRR